MQKLGSIICDACRIIICGSHPSEAKYKLGVLRKYSRTSKKGRKLNFCSAKCFEKDTKPKCKSEMKTEELS